MKVANAQSYNNNIMFGDQSLKNVNRHIHKTVIM